MSKVCTRCGAEKDESEFRQCKDWWNGKPYYYSSGSCRDCERAYQRVWNKKKRDLLPPKPIKEEPTIKFCGKCKTEKSVSEFGRYKRKLKDRIKICICTYCSQCHRDKANADYNKKKDLAEFKQLNRNRSLQNYHANKEGCRIKNKIYRETPQAKQKRKENWHKTKNIYKDRLQKSYKRYYQKSIDKLTDHYIIVQLEKEGVPRSLSKSNPELIEAKRLTLLIKRKIKNNDRH
jgi:hypothetical protein